MELIYSLVPTNFYGFFKISFILLLFIFNMYLIITHKPKKVPSIPSLLGGVEEKQPVLQAGFNNKKLKGWLGTLGMVGGFLSALITVKNEFKDTRIGRLDQLMEKDRENIRRSIDKDKEEYQKLLDSIENKREELNKLYGEQAKNFGSNDRLLTIHNKIKEKVISFKDKSIDSNVKLSELGVIDQLIKIDVNKFTKEFGSLISDMEASDYPSTSAEQIEIEPTDSTSDLKESSVFDFNIFYYLDWFESLNGVKKIAVSLIIGKSIVFSALVSIIFIFYGDILIKKYDLENRYPKLAYIIQLRREFQKIYFKYNCLLIFIVIITEVTFGIAVLLL